MGIIAASASETPVWVWVAGGVALLWLLGRTNSKRDHKASRKARETDGFSAIAGCEEAVEDLREIVAFLTEPEKFEKFGAKVPKGALLVGPPGTGKTMLARAVAAEAGVEFLSANGSDFVEMFVGVGAKRIRELYAQARSHGKAIVFIDEIDAIARKRASGAAGDTGSGGIVEHENTLIALLTELDGFVGDKVVTMAATNRPDVLDPAVLRPGRLERRVEVPTPDRAGREKILEVHTRNKPLSDNVDLGAIAKRTPGMSGADLARVCNEAALTAVRLDKKNVDQSCFDEAVELVSIGRARVSVAISDRDRRITAWHEAGHACLALLLDDAADPVAVSIVPRGPAGGVTWMQGSDDKYMTTAQAEAQIAVMLGGRVAEEILLGGGCTQGASSDLEKATELGSLLISRFGMSERGLAVRASNDHRAHRTLDSLLDGIHRHATDVLTANFALLEAIAEHLLANDRLDEQQLLELRDRHGLTPIKARRSALRTPATQRSTEPVETSPARQPATRKGRSITRYEPKAPARRGRLARLAALWRRRRAI